MDDKQSTRIGKEVLVALTIATIVSLPSRCSLKQRNFAQHNARVNPAVE